jgi:hypothetical protein
MPCLYNIQFIGYLSSNKPHSYEKQKKKESEKEIKKDICKYIAKEKIQQIKEPQLHIIQISDL